MRPPALWPAFPRPDKAPPPLAAKTSQGGCDGAEKSRTYYSQLGKSLPASTMILTLG